MTSRPSTAAPILAVLAVVLVTLGAYVGGYLWLGEREDWGTQQYDAATERQLICRVYGSEWQAQIFAPASKVEELLTGEMVRVAWRG